MTEKGCWDSFKAESATLASQIMALVRQGNARRIVVEHEGRTIAEFPLTVGVVGAVVAPVLAAVGALVAVLENCTIHVERAPERAQGAPPAEGTPGASA